MTMFRSELQAKTRPELPTRSRNIPPPSEYLEHRYRQSNQAIADSSAALLKAQLKAGHHTLTPESLRLIIKKYEWQFCIHPTLF